MSGALRQSKQLRRLCHIACVCLVRLCWMLCQTLSVLAEDCVLSATNNNNNIIDCHFERHPTNSVCDIVACDRGVFVVNKIKNAFFSKKPALVRWPT